MPLRQVLYLLVKPVLPRKPAATRADALAHAADDHEMDRPFAELTRPRT